jgi:hypothetical protein
MRMEYTAPILRREHKPNFQRGLRRHRFRHAGIRSSSSVSSNLLCCVCPSLSLGPGLSVGGPLPSTVITEELLRSHSLAFIYFWMGSLFCLLLSSSPFPRSMHPRASMIDASSCTIGVGAHSHAWPHTSRQASPLRCFDDQLKVEVATPLWTRRTTLSWIPRQHR